MYATPEPVMRWCKANETFLVNRQPVASVGLLWSQRNTDFFGRDEAAERVDAPYTGFMHALVRSRIPYLPVHADDLDRDAGKFSLLVLPNVGGLSDTQCASIRKFVDNGGSLFASGVSSLYDEWGDPRPDYALAGVFAAHRTVETPQLGATRRESSGRRGAGDRFAPDSHTYLRLLPELRATVDGPKAGDEPAITSAERHIVLRGFESTDLIPYGGTLEPLRLDTRQAVVPLTFVPPFPTYPPETSWMRQPATSVPGLVLSQKGRSRIAFMPADMDRRYAREHLPDHGDLLANVVRWAAGSIPLAVHGPGLIDCQLYRQDRRFILHLVNLTSAGTWRAPVEELIPVGPIRIGLTLPAETASVKKARLLVAGTVRPVQILSGSVHTEIPSILDHEVIVFE